LADDFVNLQKFIKTNRKH